MSEFDKMYKTHIEHIDKSNLIQRAYKSALYHYNGLSQLPYTDASDLRETWDNHSVEDIILTEKVGFWYTTSGSMGNKKWIPWTYNDYDKAGVALAEIIMNYLTPNDRVLTVVLPPPFISGTTPFKLLENTGKMGTPLEVLAFAPDFLQDGFGLLMKRKPTALICTPSFAVRIADEIAINTPKLLEARAKQENKALLKVAAAVTKLKKIYPKNIFKEMKIGIFGGEKLDPFRKILEDKWGIEAFDAYAFTEGFSGGFECSEHNGLHFPSRNGIIEIIPEKELEKEEKDPTYQPEAIILTEAEEGLIGELVLTDFKEAMPMLRYRVHDRVKIVASEGCTCKFTSPRLKILGRTDGIINMGVIRLHHNGKYM
ncbi:MAG: phenylacetate--CoA ligase family protein [Candidatus Heimdallarchaeota archaeon]